MSLPTKLLRAFAWALSTAAVGWGVLFVGGLWAAMFGAVLGVMFGERLGRSSLRLPGDMLRQVWMLTAFRRSSQWIVWFFPGPDYNSLWINSRG